MWGERGPEMRIMAMPAGPGAVARAYMVSWKLEEG